MVCPKNVSKCVKYSIKVGYLQVELLHFASGSDILTPEYIVLHSEHCAMFGISVKLVFPRFELGSFRSSFTKWLFVRANEKTRPKRCHSPENSIYGRATQSTPKPTNQRSRHACLQSRHARLFTSVFAQTDGDTTQNLAKYNDIFKFL